MRVTPPRQTGGVHLAGGRLILSPTDLTGFLACPELARLELAAVRGDVSRPAGRDPELEVLARLGDEHERSHLEALRALRPEPGQVVELSRPGNSPQELEAAEAETVAAMGAGAAVIYQASFFDGSWRGHADFLLRVDRPCPRWPWSYEVVDTKLARRVRVAALVQLACYADHLARIQGRAPEQVHVVGGDGRKHSYRLADMAAYVRGVKARFLDQVVGADAAGEQPPYPEPVDHCGVCVWAETCQARWRADDRLWLVAGMRGDQARKLGRAGLGTVAALAGAAPGTSVAGVGPGAVERLRHQAALQVRQRETGLVHHEVLAPDGDGRGLAGLPAPSPGDLFFDIEADPWAGEAGLEYLFGVVDLDQAGAARYRAFWALDQSQERCAFEAVMDLVVERLARHPDMHVYHYAPYETAALKRLMGRHGTREAELDRLLRAEVFVDLYRVVRQGVRVSQDSYSLKKLEPLYLAERTGDISGGAASIVAFERWRETGDGTLLRSLEDYNRLDCVSLVGLRQWLEQRRVEAEACFGAPLPRPRPRSGDAGQDQQEAETATQELAGALCAGMPDDSGARTEEEEGRWLLAQLLSWHRREAKPGWWAYFDRLGRSDEELRDDSESIGELDYRGVVGEVVRSLIHRYRFDPSQEHKMGPGDEPYDPRTGRSAGVIVALDAVEGTVDLRRGRDSGTPHPRSLVPAPPIRDTVLRQAIAVLGAWVGDHGLDPRDGEDPQGRERGEREHRAVRQLLLRRPPAVPGTAPGSPLQRPGEQALDAARRLALSMDHACLTVQGPPGSGKTVTGAAMVVELVAAHRRVGICGPSHKAITNLLNESCRQAEAAGVRLRAIQKADQQDSCAQDCVEVTSDNGRVQAAVAEGEVDVVAGTAWLFARPAMAGTLDMLLVDEAGQMPLANAVAVSGAADNLVLLGDPRQLAQPSRAQHPGGAGASALEHALGEHQTVPPALGLFLDVTWRMHPELCDFVSEVVYQGRLRSEPSCARQRVEDGSPVGGVGIRFLPVEHTGNRTSSPEEAAAVAALMDALVGRLWTDREGVARPLTLDDVLVVAPYNAQVACLARALPAAARIGTVDRFQGQEAAVVICSLATSTGEYLPRGLEFLYSINRLNVAVSRARALALVVASPDLLAVRCRSPDQLRMVNALGRLAELGDTPGWRAAAPEWSLQL